MRIVIEVSSGEGDRIQGLVIEGADAPPRPFSGWLELLAFLEIAANRSRGNRPYEEA